MDNYKNYNLSKLRKEHAYEKNMRRTRAEHVSNTRMLTIEIMLTS